MQSVMSSGTRRRISSTAGGVCAVWPREGAAGAKKAIPANNKTAIRIRKTPATLTFLLNDSYSIPHAQFRMLNSACSIPHARFERGDFAGKKAHGALGGARDGLQPVAHALGRLL